MANTSSYLGGPAEYYTLKLSAQTVSSEGTDSFYLCPICPWLQ